VLAMARPQGTALQAELVRINVGSPLAGGPFLNRAGRFTSRAAILGLVTADPRPMPGVEIARLDMPSGPVQPDRDRNGRM